MAQLMTLNPFNDFKADMATAKTLGDLDRAIENNLTQDECLELYSALKMVETALELTYRDKTVKRALKARLQYGFGLNLEEVD